MNPRMPKPKDPVDPEPPSNTAEVDGPALTHRRPRRLQETDADPTTTPPRPGGAGHDDPVASDDLH